MDFAVKVSAFDPIQKQKKKLGDEEISQKIFIWQNTTYPVKFVFMMSINKHQQCKAT